MRANPDGSIVRLADVARVELGSKDYEFIGRYNGQPATLVGIFLSPGANALEVAQDRADARSPSSATQLPEGLVVRDPVRHDALRRRCRSARSLKTLGEAMILVFLVVYLFLQSWRATVIPFVAVPVSLIGTFAGIYVLGYSINTLTLFGMVLSIGIVVDDAIVVLENVERIMREEHLRAARRRDQGDARGDRPDHRDRADAVRRCSCRSRSSAASPASSTASSR